MQPRRDKRGQGERPPVAPDRTETIDRRSGSGATPISAERARTPRPDDLDGEGYQLLQGDPDRYESQGEHARGGLGRVVKALDQRLGRTVAIKELLARTTSAEARFVREAVVTARLQHPGVVPVHEAGRWPNGDPYYVMKLISGRSMRDLIRDRDQLAERLALLPNVIAVAETVAYAHSEGVIHRDIKPANVMVGEFGETVLVDWGIAKDRRGAVEAADGGSAPAGGSGHTAGILGTPAYMAPEQARGDEVDERCDVYALGALLYEVLAGEQPYSDSDSGDVVSRVLAGPPVPLEQLQPGVPPDLLAVVRKAMARVPEQRYWSAKELAEDLKRFQTGKLVTAHAYSTITLIRRWMGRNRTLVAASVVALLLVSALGVLAVNRIVDERNLARSQQAQAEAATRSTEKRRLQLLLLQARSSLDRDPTATIAWLKTYPTDGPGLDAMRAMVDDAEARGVARHVFRLGDWGFDVAFSPDGSKLFAAGRDKSVWMFDVATGARQTLGRHDRAIHTVAVSPDGQQVATGTDMGEVALWGVSGDHGARAKLMDSPIVDLQISADGKKLVALGQRLEVAVAELPGLDPVVSARGKAAISPAADAVLVFEYKTGEATLIDLETGQQTTLPEPAGERRVVHAAVSSGGRQVALIDEKGHVHLFEGGGGWRQLGRHAGKVDNLQFSPSGARLVSMGFDKTIRLFDVTGSDEPTVLRGHDDAIYMVAFAPDESFMVSAGDDATARVWDLRTERSWVLRGHEDDVYRVAISPDGSQISTVSLDETVRLWPAPVPKDRSLHAGEAIDDVRFAAAGSIVAHTFGGSLRAWNASGQHRELGRSAVTGDKLIGRRPASDRSGRYLVSFGPDEDRLTVWDLVADTSFELVGDPKTFAKPLSIAMAPDGSSVLASYDSGAVVLWNLADRTPRVLAGGARTLALAFSPKGDEVSMAHSGRLTVWNLADQKVVIERDLSDSANLGQNLRQIVYSADGRWLAVLSLSGTTWVIDRASGDQRRFETGDVQLIRIAISADGNWLAGAAVDRTVRLWRVDTGEQRVLQGHADLVNYVQFSPDSSLLASASYDKTVRLWDVASGQARVLRGHALSVDGLAFSADGTTLASGSRDGTVRLWDVAASVAGGTRAEIQRRLQAITTAEIGPDDRPETGAMSL